MSNIFSVIRNRTLAGASTLAVSNTPSRAVRAVRAFSFGDVDVTPPFAGDPLGFIGSGLRLPVATQTRSGNNYVAGDMAMGMPSYDVDEIYFFFPAFACPTSAEVHCPNGYTIEGIGTRASGGQRTLGQINDGTASIVLDPSDDAMTNGVWIKFTPDSTIAADSVQVFSFAQYIPDGLYPQSRVATAATTNIFGGTTKDERSQQSSSSLLSTLSGSSDYTTSSKHVVFPSAAMARKPSGEVSALIIGTSIAYGAHQTNNANVMTDRHEFGFMAMGLDDNQGSDRVGYLNWAIPGWGHESTGADNSQGNSAKCARQIWALDKARELNGDRTVIDALFCEHGTNTSGNQTTLRADYRTMYALWLGSIGTASGDDKTPVYQAEMLPYPQTTDAFATLGNQTVTTGNEYPSGTRWLINADIGGADGLGDASANLRADGAIQGSFAPWRETAHDTASERDKLSVRAFSTTLAADYGGSGTVSLTDEPTLGDKLMMDDGTNTADFVALSYTGSGPYTVTGQFFSGGGTSFTAASTAVQSVWHDTLGLHPSPLGHIAYKASLVALKVALGWTAPPDVTAPTITSSSPSGSYEEGVAVSGTLTANETVTWSVSGTDAGAVTLNTSTGAWSLEATDYATQSSYSFTFTATDGSSNATNQVVAITITEITVSAALTALLAIIDGNSNCSAVDFTEATDSGTYVAADLSDNSNDYTQASGSQKFTISGTLGGVATAAIENAAPDSAGAASTMVFSFTKDASDADGFLSSQTSPTQFRYTSGSATAVTGAEVDGVAEATRGDLHDALDDSAEHVVTLTGETQGKISRASSGFIGSVRRLVLIDEAQVTGSDYTDAVAEAETWVAES